MILVFVSCLSEILRINSVFCRCAEYFVYQCVCVCLCVHACMCVYVCTCTKNLLLLHRMTHGCGILFVNACKRDKDRDKLLFRIINGFTYCVGYLLEHNLWQILKLSTVKWVKYHKNSVYCVYGRLFND